MNTLSEANGTFAIHLLKMLCQSNPSENVCYSPVSISSALAMVLLGAKGQTAVQISQVLNLKPDEDIHQGFQLFLHNLNEPKSNYCLRMTNRLFTENSCELLPTFKESCIQFYQSEMEQLSFAKAAVESVKHINMWVSKYFKGKISELLSSDSVNSQTRLILVNALYFQEMWHQHFHKNFTKELSFKMNMKDTKTVKMMDQRNNLPFGYIPDMKCKVLAMPYQGGELSMIILLPEDTEDEFMGLRKIEQKLTLEKLHEWNKHENLRNIDVHVKFPWFKMEESYILNFNLCCLGVQDLFSRGKADLSGMSGSRDLFISKIVHKSFVEVNEEGTEAAAAMAGIIGCSLGREKEFTVDHPFLFFIQHNPTANVLFLGRVCFP
ncbi:leukocyte elastase inhibitor B-like isoform X2 [Grammomys surdaster]|uniref:leukocyte elastase inhibitor B-like isoform X2 n=1 Tax=Grammomys surdaster TaxID=491861 RepID=UPI0010A08186|nr:leukocyte elastase inhibitor B-like isoform X2 [Grammomys surdaster]